MKVKFLFRSFQRYGFPGETIFLLASIPAEGNIKYSIDRNNLLCQSSLGIVLKHLIRKSPLENSMRGTNGYAHFLVAPTSHHKFFKSTCILHHDVQTYHSHCVMSPSLRIYSSLSNGAFDASINGFFFIHQKIHQNCGWMKSSLKV